MAQPFYILVADDDPNDVFFLRRAFKKAGLNHNVLDVRDGNEVLEYLSGNGEFADRSRFPMPDLLFLDLKMPKMTGFEVLEWLQSQPGIKKMPVVVFSSSALDGDRQKATLLGADDYRVKPNDLDELITLVREMNSKWCPENELTATTAG